MIQKHCNLAADSVFSGAPTLFLALHDLRLAPGPRTAGGRETVALEGEGEAGEREINMQEEGSEVTVERVQPTL